MDLKAIQRRLCALRDRIRVSGKMTRDDEEELKMILQSTLNAANGELRNIQSRLDAMMAPKADNDNELLRVHDFGEYKKQQELSKDQKERLILLEKSDNGSIQIH